MVETKVLCVYEVIIGSHVLRYVLDLPIVEDQTADFAPFSEAIYLISLWVNDLSTLHSGSVGIVYEPVAQICGVMCQHIGIWDIKKDLLDPMVFINRIEGHSDLIELPFWKFTSQAVIYDFNVGLCELCCLFQPHIGQLALLECNGLQLFSLFVIVHSTEYDLVAVVSASQLHRRLVDLPVFLCLITKHPIYCACQFCKGAISIGYIGLAHSHKVSTRISHKAKDVLLRRIHTFARACRSLFYDIPLFALVNLFEARISFDGYVHKNITTNLGKT